MKKTLISGWEERHWLGEEREEINIQQGLPENYVQPPKSLQVGNHFSLASMGLCFYGDFVTRMSHKTVFRVYGRE